MRRGGCGLSSASFVDSCWLGAVLLVLEPTLSESRSSL